MQLRWVQWALQEGNRSEDGAVAGRSRCGSSRSDVAPRPHLAAHGPPVYPARMHTLLKSAVLILALFAPGVALAQDGSFTNAGLELHYTSAGTGQPAIILSGGPGLNVDYMKSMAEFLPDGYRRIFLEQRGTGRSRPAPPESLT